MKNPETFFWYDLETFGLNPCWDRIAQFAGIRTDMDLNVIGDPVELYSKLSLDYLPDPGSCLVTGITPQEVNTKGIPEAEFITRINELFSQPNTIVCGFNSIHFDDEFIRNSLYRNLMDPYEREYSRGCSRWDIMDLVRAAHDLRPEGIRWPRAKENGNPSFKLTELTDANKIEQIGAHDAMVDVYATINVAKLIKQKQPKLFDYYLKMRDKTLLRDIVKTPNGKPLLHVSPIFTTPAGCSSLIMPVTAVSNNKNAIVCFDLRKDPIPALEKTGKDALTAEGVFTLSLNKCPFLAEPEKMLTEELAKKLNIDVKTAYARAEIIRNHPEFSKNLSKAKEEDEYTSCDDPDFKLYSGPFFTSADQSMFDIIRLAQPQKKLSMMENLRFNDGRAATMVARYVARNWPRTLDEKTLAQWKRKSLDRLSSPPGGVLMCFDYYERKIADHLQDADMTDKKKEILEKLSEYGKKLKTYLEN